MPARPSEGEATADREWPPVRVAPGLRNVSTLDSERSLFREDGIISLFGRIPHPVSSYGSSTEQFVICRVMGVL